MTTLYLVRHGETSHNNEGIMQGRLDVPLNETGIKQAELLADALADEHFDAVYASPLKRAFQTAEILVTEREVDAIPHEAFKERSKGVLEDEPREKRTRILENTPLNKSEWRPEDGENMEDVGERVVPAVHDILDRHLGERVLVVAHGGVNRCLISYALSGTTIHAHKISQDNTCVNVLHAGPSFWKIVRVNDSSHLRAVTGPAPVSSD